MENNIAIDNFKVNIIVPNAHWAFVTKGNSQGEGSDSGNFTSNDLIDKDDATFSQAHYFAKKNLLDCKVYGGFFAWDKNGSSCKLNLSLTLSNYDETKIVFSASDVVKVDNTNSVGSHQKANVDLEITLGKNDDDSILLTVTPKASAGAWGTTSWTGAFGAISYITLKGENE